MTGAEQALALLSVVLLTPGCTAAGRAVSMSKAHPPLAFTALHMHRVQFIDGLYNATAASGVLCPHPIFTSQPLFVHFSLS